MVNTSFLTSSHEITENHKKLDNELFPKSNTLHEILSFSHIFCQWFYLTDFKISDILPLTQSKKMLTQHDKES